MRIVKGCSLWQWLVTAITVGLTVSAGSHQLAKNLSLAGFCCVVLDLPFAAPGAVALMVFALHRCGGAIDRKAELFRPVLIGIALNFTPITISIVLVVLDKNAFG